METAYPPIHHPQPLSALDIVPPCGNAALHEPFHSPQILDNTPPYGFDVLVNIIKATNLPSCDWWNGLSDPYIIVCTTTPDGTQIEYRTRTAWQDLNPHYDEFFELGNLPEGSQLLFEVWDKDLVTANDFMGSALWGFNPRQQPSPQEQEWHHQWQQPRPPQELEAQGTRQNSWQEQQQGGDLPEGEQRHHQLQQSQPWDQKQQPSPPQQADQPEPPQARQQFLEGQQSEGREVPITRLHFHLKLHDPKQENKAVGELELKVVYHPSREEGTACMLGPVRFRQHLSLATGMLMGNCNDNNTMAYSTYKLYLCHIQGVFDGVRCEWNRAHANAAKLFKSPLLLSGVRSQHAALYATQLGSSRVGVLRDAEDFFVLFNNGERAGQRRYFTYTLMPDSLRCSETGAKFFTDMFSKHAMHAGAEEEVLFAGEFCIVPDDTAQGGCRLVIDNNSGTYAPKTESLPLMAKLFTANFPGMCVETLAVGDPKLDEYHQQAPSRVGAAAAPPAAAGGNTSGDSAGVGEG